MNDKNQEEEIDDFFKDALDGLFAAPPAANWQKITTQLDHQEMDVLAKSQLERLEVTPPPEAWNHIKGKLPLSLLIRSRLNQLSKIAAVLIVFMIVLLAMNRKEVSKTFVISKSPVIESLEITLVHEVSNDFVFAINDGVNEKETSASEELSLEDEKTVEDFWSSIMDEEEELADVDHEVIQKSLVPILELPIENLKAAVE